MAFTITITNAGRAAIVNAQNTGTAPVTIAQIGLSATAIVPAPTMTVLAGELKRTGSIAGDVVADDTIHVTAMDESADVYSLRAFGLYLADGTLFAIYGQATPILEKVAASIALLAIDVIFADIDAAAITFGDASFINPPATTERQGVVELATVAEAQAGIDALRALTPTAAKAAILGWLLAQDGSGSGLDADMLDGQHGAYYANIPARLGYTPANKAGETFTGGITAPTFALSETPNVYLGQAGGNVVLFGDSNDHLMYIKATNVWLMAVDNVAQWWIGGDGLVNARVGFRAGGSTVWHAGNDGSGSGLDADLLGGAPPSFFANIPARLGYTPANKAGETFDGTIGAPTYFINGIANAYLGSAGGNPVLNGDNFDFLMFDRATNVWLMAVGGVGQTWTGGDGLVNARVGFLAGGNTVWHAGNDGAGSGLDADLWRGKTPAQHIADYHLSGSNANGQWRKYPDGAGGFVLEQWGAVDLGTGFNVQYADVTFPVEFSAAAPIHISGNANKGANAGWNVCSVCFDDPTTAGSRITADSASPTQYFNRVVTVRWKAIGKAP